MFRAIGRWFRAIGYLFTGRIDRARRSVASNPDVIRATYDRVISDKRTHVLQYKDAVAAMIGQEEKKKATLTTLTEEIQQLERMKAGAAAMAKKVIVKHAGDIEAIKKDPEYVRCQAAFKDFNTTLAEKIQRAEELEADVVALSKNIADHKIQIQGVLRGLETIKEEKHDAVADVISAREEQQIADMVSGISDDRTSEELAELRDLRREAKAKATMSREMAGLDAKRDEQEFLAYATETTADDEFDALIGLSREAEEGEGGPAGETKIPEA